MDDERFEPGMPVLDRQQVDAAGDAGATRAGVGGAVTAGAVAGPGAIGSRPAPPRSVPETRPTPLQKHYALVSAPALVLGAIAITALELGSPLGSPLVKACVLLATPLLAVANADAIVRIWRSAWAWMPVDRGRGLFRLAWVVAAAILYGLLVGAAWLVLAA
jgi:hypothetical protein